MTASPAISAPVGGSEGHRPPVPESIADTGLNPEAIKDLLLKTLYVQGSRTGAQLADTLCLPYALIDDELLSLQQRRFVEVRGTGGPNRVSYIFDVVGAGRDRARDALEASQYVGPAPVPLAQYKAWVEAQSIDKARVSQAAIRTALNHLVLNEDLIDALGPAVNSAKSLFLYGHPGNGKTAVAEAIAGMLGGTIYVPYAVDIDGQIMLVYDPVYHTPAQEEGAPAETQTLEDALWRRTGVGYDRRFARVRRPVVLTGGELSLEQLDLRYDPFAKLYQAPFQVKANGGVLIVDDFGRQRTAPRDLLNRWIVPLEKRMDFLTLHTGGKFPIPFDSLLIFATNLEPQSLAEEAFLRRIHYKIHVVDPTREQYEEIFQRCCATTGVTYHPAAVEHVYRHYYTDRSIAPRSCHPRDLLGHLVDTAKYMEAQPKLNAELVDRACRSYFLDPANTI